MSRYIGSTEISAAWYLATSTKTGRGSKSKKANEAAKTWDRPRDPQRRENTEQFLLARRTGSTCFYYVAVTRCLERTRWPLRFFSRLAFFHNTSRRLLTTSLQIRKMQLLTKRTFRWARDIAVLIVSASVTSLLLAHYTRLCATRIETWGEIDKSRY